VTKGNFGRGRLPPPGAPRKQPGRPVRDLASKPSANDAQLVPGRQDAETAATRGGFQGRGGATNQELSNDGPIKRPRQRPSERPRQGPHALSGGATGRRSVEAVPERSAAVAPAPPAVEEGGAAEPSAAELYVGRLIGDRYRLLEAIGRGGMGLVFRGEHTLMRKAVAIKLLHQELSSVDDAIKRFEREAQSASRLSHGNIVTVTDFGRAESGEFFLVMEYVAGDPLDAVIAERGPLPLARAVEITRDILRGLAHAHDAGVVHRDLKPANIMVMPREGRDAIKILDFGIAKLTSNEAETASMALTRGGMIFGTPSYMAPEQATGDPVDARADLYACGVILYEMLTGKKPFVADDLVKVMAQQVTAPPPSFAQAAPHLTFSAAHEAVVMKALAKDRADRFVSARAFLDALDEAEASASARRSSEPSGGRAVAALWRGLVGSLGRRLSAPGRPRSGGLVRKVQTLANGAQVRLTSQRRRAPNSKRPDSKRKHGIRKVPGGRAHQQAGAFARLRSVLVHAGRTDPGRRGIKKWAQRAPLLAACAALLVLVGAALLWPGDDLVTPKPAQRVVQEPLAEARRFMAAGKIDSAKALLLDVLSRHPDSAHLRFELGTIAFVEDDVAGALRLYRESLRQEPSLRGDPALVVNLQALVNQGRHARIALDFLIDIVGKPARPVLAEIASSDKRLALRTRARQGCEQLSCRDVDWVASYALDLRQEKSCKARRAAVASLAATGDKRAIPILRRALKNDGSSLHRLLGMRSGRCLQPAVAKALKVLGGAESAKGAG